MKNPKRHKAPWTIGMLLLGTLLLWQPLLAQQDPLFSQYMFNRLVLNPAYAGSREQLSAVLIHRQQWVGFDGAPTTQSFGMHAPSVDRRHGFGLSLIHDRAGFVNTTQGTFSYAYRIPVGAGRLCLGLQTGIQSYWSRLSEIETWQAGDDAFGTGGDFGKLVFVAGPGIYFSNDRFYLGASMPDMIPHKFYDIYYEQLEARSSRHAFAMGGLMLDIGRNVSFRPSFMLRYVAGAPLSVDLSGSFLFAERIWLGASYRPANAWVFIAEIYLTKMLRVGYSYDYALAGARSTLGPSHELMLGFDLGFEKKKMISPRLF